VEARRQRNPSLAKQSGVPTRREREVGCEAKREELYEPRHVVLCGGTTGWAGLTISTVNDLKIVTIKLL